MKNSVQFTVFSKPWRQPLPEVARHVRQLGFDGIELPVRPGFQVQPESIARDLPLAVRIFADEGLRISSIAGPTDAPTIHACAQAGVPLIRTLVKVPPQARYLATMDQAIREFENLLPYLQQARVKIGIQNHCYREVSSIMGLHYLVHRFDPAQIGAVLDVGHCGLAGEAADMTVDVLLSHLCLVNFKNAIWQRSSAQNAPVGDFECYWTSGRQGMAHWPQFAAELQKFNYTGDVCLTAEYSQEHLLETLLMEDLAFAKSLWPIKTEHSVAR